MLIGIGIVFLMHVWFFMHESQLKGMNAYTTQKNSKLILTIQCTYT